MILLAFFFGSCFVQLAASQNNPCVVNIGDVYTVTEQDPPGTVIVRINATEDVTWSFTIDYIGNLARVKDKLDPYLSLTRQNDTGQIVFVFKVNQTLDLEQVYADLNIQLSTLSLKLSCQNAGGQSVNKDIFLTILPVNEYEPKFVNDTFDVSISEFTGEHHVLIQLNQYAHDDDVNPTTTEIRGFSIQPFNYSTIDNGKPEDDGSPYFSMANTQSGRIELIRPLDYDQLVRDDQTTMYLNVTVQDTSDSMTWATVRVHVEDYDDLSPEFYYRGCPTLTMDPCLVIYMVRILENTTGPADDIRPAPIYAHDRDTIDNPVKYKLRDADSASDRGISSHLEINSTTGRLTVVKPFFDLDVYTVFVVAEEVSQNRLTALATLQIDVYSPDYDPALMNTTMTNLSPGDNTRSARPNDPRGTSPIGSDDDKGNDSGDSDQVAVIGMSVLGVLVLGLLIALFIVGFALRKSRIAKVAPEEALDEETASQQTQLSTAGEGSPTPHVDQERLLSSLPEPGTRGNKLPPLQPGNGAQPTANGGPQLDIFDGTRTFQTDVNPDFFTTPKPKVPREAGGPLHDGRPIIIND